jgi:hypothetical protein
MKIEWLFIDADKSTRYADENVPRIPSLGDGKADSGKGYEVKSVVTRFTTDVPLVVAVEHV